MLKTMSKIQEQYEQEILQKQIKEEEKEARKQARKNESRANSSLMTEQLRMTPEQIYFENKKQRETKITRKLNEIR